MMNTMNNSEETKVVDSVEVNVQTTPSIEQPISLVLESPESGVVPSLSDGQLSPDSPEPASGQFTPTLLNELKERIETLAARLEEGNRLAMDRERIIDNLHHDNQSLRQGELQQALLPVLRDSIRLFDDLKQTSRNYAERQSLVPANVASDFRCFAETVSDILYRYGVESYSAAAGDPFNAKDHRVLGVVQTFQKEKDRTIARIIREGFRSNLITVRLLEAEVYRYVPDADSQNKDEASRTQ